MPLGGVHICKGSDKGAASTRQYVTIAGEAVTRTFTIERARVSSPKVPSEAGWCIAVPRSFRKTAFRLTRHVQRHSCDVAAASYDWPPFHTHISSIAIGLGYEDNPLVSIFIHFCQSFRIDF